MPNPYFNNTIDLLPNTRARSIDVESNLSAVEAGFDAVSRDLLNSVRSNAQYVTANTNAVSGGVYALGASLTLLLPASPTVNDWVGFVNRSGTLTCTVARNGSNICGLAEDMNLDDKNAYGCLVYVDATRGWVFF